MPARAFPLLPVFSIASLLVLCGFTLLLSWLLGNQLEEELLSRDTLITTTTVQSEVVEYLGNRSFETLYQDTELLKDVLHAVTMVPGSHGVEIIHPDGLIGWSSIHEEVGEYKDSAVFRRAMSGKATLKHEMVDEQAFPHADARYASALYIPIPRGSEILGVVEVHRYNVQLKRQVDSLRQSVWVYSLGFGSVLYLTLLLIIFPASRILRRQHNSLLDNAQELAQANRELRAAQSQLLKQERLAAMGEVSASVAHGLKNPIAGLRAALQLLSIPSITQEESKEIVLSLLREIDRLTERVNHLLNFVRPFHPNPTALSLYPMVVEAGRSLEWRLREKHIELHLPEPSVLPEVQADPSLLEEAFLIVLSNALDASPEGSRIECTVETNATHQWIRVTDEGDGISAEHMEHIFEQFYTTRSRGIGLGLALCKKIMEAHHGSIELDSQEHQGTTVRLILPNTPSELPHE